jgi:crotonobetainyl-CoA:carnitine CoA-transferase CaiB-like acyl-CoA transferase
VGPGFAYGDHVIGLYGALAVLASLENRHRTGCGQYVDLSGYEALCTVLGPALMEASLDTIRASSQAVEHGWADACPSGCYRCRGTDRWCVISVSSEDEWRALCRVLNRDDWLSDERFRTMEGRKAHYADLDKQIEKWTMERTAEEVAALLQESGVPAGVVQNAADIVHDPHLAARRFFAEMNHPVLGRTIGDRSPIRFAEDGIDSRWKAAPLLGEDNRYVFMELLGLTEEEFHHYREKGIIA